MRRARRLVWTLKCIASMNRALICNNRYVPMDSSMFLLPESRKDNGSHRNPFHGFLRNDDYRLLAILLYSPALAEPIVSLFNIYIAFWGIGAPFGPDSIFMI